MGSKSTGLKRAGLQIALAVGLLGSAAAPAMAAGTLTIAMTLSDLPDWTGAPDQGFEGTRFAGFTMYEGLIGFDLSSADTESTLKPALATSWDVDPDDQRKWTFHLREDVSFHDGCAFDANVAKWNFDRLMDESHPAYNQTHASRQSSRVAGVESVEAVDDYTLVVTTSEVNALFQYDVPYVFMISECAMEADGNDYTVFAEHPSGTGPYEFASVVPHERLELVPFADYWDENRIPQQDRMVLLPMSEASTRASALLSGQVNFIEAPSPDMIPALESAGMQIVTNSYPHTWPYLLNTLEGPFADLKVRQAANYAVNRDEVVQLLGGYAEPSWGMYIPSQAAYGDVTEYPHDTERSQELLAEAGCAPCEITIAISTGGSGQMQSLPMNELIKSQLEQGGFSVTLQTVDFNTLLSMFLEGAAAHPELDAVNFSMGAIDPLYFIRSFNSANAVPYGGNWGGYANAEVDELLNQVYTTFDTEERNALLAQAHAIVTAEAARVPVVSDVNPRAMAPSVKGFVQAQSWFQDFTPITVE